MCFWFACSHTTFPSFSPHHLVSLSPERSLGLLVSREAKKEAAKFKVVACASHCASHHQLVPTYSISLVIHRLCLSHERLQAVAVQFLLPLASCHTEMNDCFLSLVQFKSLTYSLIALAGQVSRV